ncbi:MAG: peptide chain release factor N(5)-glutamine methyltransferase [Shinella sp.]|nr:MAG: peptide chain release factor N(5)-glutamine methyltransferase [Shinella sp.]
MGSEKAGPDTVGSLIAEAKQRFSTAGLVDPATDARVLVSGLLRLSATAVVLGANQPVDAGQVILVRSAIDRRAAREPVHRILGERDFYGLTLKLSPDTLEPRPDTEILVDAILPHLERIAAKKGETRILDIGTGSGAIALALLKECGTARAIGTDISAGALTIAANNAYLNGVGERFEALESVWFEKIEERHFDIIVSNPPYIPTKVVEALEPEVRDFDPVRALDGGQDGLIAYRAIADNAASHLAEGGVVGLEIGYDQKQPVIQIFEAKGFSLLDARQDYGGNDRVLLFHPRRT